MHFLCVSPLWLQFGRAFAIRGRARDRGRARVGGAAATLWSGAIQNLTFWIGGSASAVCALGERPSASPADIPSLAWACRYSTICLTALCEWSGAISFNEDAARFDEYASRIVMVTLAIIFSPFVSVCVYVCVWAGVGGTCIYIYIYIYRERCRFCSVTCRKSLTTMVQMHPSLGRIRCKRRLTTSAV